ncbi:PREDICTED: NSFL1 cofactor p47-like [Ceratosolen solmsi marchali]|uniref:NSFL1 cofactor p47-like n=1 Tax=Ceratosolen solmsi marchali TaxID=326594 RepID=A0AAJ6YIQ5_9HYME|nr:PREDICTED: NSFL1 cofactor p47-like [Ceratosolen solmsi marchali]
MDDREGMIAHFEDVTGVDTARARFYLESSAWQIDVALGRFFEYDTEREQEEDLYNESNDLARRQEPIPTEKKPSKTKSKKKSNFGTIQDFQNKESSSDEEEGQAFYAGGSETSGQQILGPGKKNDIITDMFKSCQKQDTSGESSTSSSSQHRPNTFVGTGYKLGMTSNDTEVVTPTPSERRPSTSLITLKLWQNGFTINDREIRPYDDPENKEFLAAIKRGEIPLGIRQEVQGGEVHLNMEDHRHEEYIPPKPKIKAFSGKGQMLGSPSPATVGVTVSVDPADQAANEVLARNQLNINNEQPSTTIQIRLADGSNVRAQFNLSHTIGDVRRYVINVRPQYALRDFNLQTTFPTKELTEESKTIEELNLQNSVIMQRLK